MMKYPVVKDTELVLLEQSERLGIENLINLDDYSEIDRLFKTTANMLTAVDHFKRQSVENQPAVEWLRKAEVLWIRAAQALLHLDSKYRIWEGQFNLFVDEWKLIRC